MTVWAAALTAGLCFEIPASRASYGDAPWCLIKTGGDSAYGDCQFEAFQECLQARTGNSGIASIVMDFFQRRRETVDNHALRGAVCASVIPKRPNSVRNYGCDPVAIVLNIPIKSMLDGNLPAAAIRLASW